MIAGKPLNKACAGIVERIHAAGDRARQEADTRRKSREKAAPPANEIGGPAGPEPTRYGDWERKGIASDF